MKFKIINIIKHHFNTSYEIFCSSFKILCLRYVHLSKIRSIFRYAILLSRSVNHNICNFYPTWSADGSKKTQSDLNSSYFC